MSQFPKRESSPEIKVLCADSKKFKVMNSIKSQLTKGLDFISISTIDGVRAKMTSTGWFLIRASNTSPYLSVRLEGINAHEKSLLTRKVASILSDNGLTF